MHRYHVLLVLLSYTIGLPGTLNAQRLAPTWESRNQHKLPLPGASAREASEHPEPASRLGGGFIGALAGLAVGQLAYQASGGGRLCGDDSCGLYVGLLATVIAEPVLIPVGVHLANHR